MTFKKFIAPNIATILVLFFAWFAGFESIFAGKNSDEQNIEKYMEAQSKIYQNYVDILDIDDLYKNSIRGFVSNLQDSTLSLNNTPLDTNFTDLQIGSLRESVSNFEKAYQFMANNAVNEDIDKRVEDAIKGMFNKLDPHSIYIESEQSDRIEEEFTGKFQGIGIQFEVRNDTITVVTAISGGPSDQLGIRSGDRIVQIDDSSSVGFTERDVANTLRGPKGSTVKVGIKRPLNSDLINFDIIRDDIPLHTVDASYMLDENTGYVRVSRFAATTHQEFISAMSKLDELGMERLMLDMRGNPGGYLEQAVRITNEFFPRGTSLVATESRHSRFTSNYRANRNGRYMDMPIIMLVDEGSASGSEIVSGALQDHDRALIVGRRTFGKGLVQQQYELPDDSNIRVTISRYNTPSGRLIQKPYSQGREEYAYEIRERKSGDIENFTNSIPDSLTYETSAGRAVYGGGGVVPDHVVPVDTSTNYVYTLMRSRNIASQFVRNYLDNNNDKFRDEWEDRFKEFQTDFNLSEEDREQVQNLMVSKGLVFSDTLSAPKIQNDSLHISKERYNEDIKSSESYIKAEIARQVWGNEYFYPIINSELDDAVRVARTLWPDVQELKAYARQASLK
ncbi:MAG: S41 family peptidase [Balneolales bacterium]